jgi:hypothetical protein
MSSSYGPGISYRRRNPQGQPIYVTIDEREARAEAAVVEQAAQALGNVGNAQDINSLTSYRQQLSALLQRGVAATQQQLAEIIRLTSLIAIFVIDITASANNNNYLQQLSQNEVFANIPIPDSVRSTIQNAFSRFVGFAADVSDRALTISDLIHGVEETQGVQQGEQQYQEVQQYQGVQQQQAQGVGPLNADNLRPYNAGSKRRRTRKSKRSKKSKKSKRRRTHRRK